MKTNNITKKSLLTSMILMATAMFAAKNRPAEHHRASHREGGSVWNPQAIFIPRRGKFKGYMRQSGRSSFNKTR